MVACAQEPLVPGEEEPMKAVRLHARGGPGTLAYEDAPRPEPGDGEVLVQGAAGGVGLFAVQLARRRGARVVGTASAQNLDFVRGLGADEVLDYRATRFEDAVRDVDVVFDTVGDETLERSWGVLRPGG